MCSLQEFIPANSSYEKGYTQIRPNKRVTGLLLLSNEKSPGCAGGFSLLCINCSESGITHTPHDCAGLAWVFAILGLDRILWRICTGKTRNGCFNSTRCSDASL